MFKILFHTLNHYRRKWLNIRMVKESEEILETAAAVSYTHLTLPTIYSV